MALEMPSTIKAAENADDIRTNPAVFKTLRPGLQSTLPVELFYFTARPRKQKGSLQHGGTNHEPWHQYCG